MVLLMIKESEYAILKIHENITNIRKTKIYVRYFYQSCLINMTSNASLEGGIGFGLRLI